MRQRRTGGACRAHPAFSFRARTLCAALAATVLCACSPSIAMAAFSDGDGQGPGDAPSGTSFTWGETETGGVVFDQTPVAAGALSPNRAGVSFPPCNSPAGPFLDSLAKLNCTLDSLVQFAGNPVGALTQFLRDQIFSSCSGRDCNGSGGAGSSLLGNVLTGRTPRFFDAGPDQRRVDNPFTHLWSVCLAASAALVALAATLRIMRMTFEHQPLSVVLPQIAPRLVAAMAGAGLSYRVLGGLSDVMGTLGHKAFEALAATGQEPGDAMAASINAAVTLTGMPPVAMIPIFVALLMLIYLMLLMLTRQMMLIFTVVCAPIAIALGAYDTRSELFIWWWKMFAGAAITPVIVGLVLGITFALAGEGYKLFPVLGPFASGFILLGGLVFLGKVVTQLTFGAIRSSGRLSGVMQSAVGGFIGERLGEAFATRGAGFGPRQAPSGVQRMSKELTKSAIAGGSMAGASAATANAGMSPNGYQTALPDEEMTNPDSTFRTELSSYLQAGYGPRGWRSVELQRPGLAGASPQSKIDAWLENPAALTQVAYLGNEYATEGRLLRPQEPPIDSPQPTDLAADRESADGPGHTREAA